MTVGREMDLGMAVGASVSPGPDGSGARRIVGAYLGTVAGLGPGMAVLGIGVWGLELIEGARSKVGDLRRYAVRTYPRPGWGGGVDLQWMTPKPPADQRLVIFYAPLLTGVDVVAVLDDLRRDGLPPVTLCVPRARPGALALIRESYPEVEVITVRCRPATTTSRSEPGEGEEQ